MTNDVARKTWEENFQTRKAQLQYQKPSSHTNNFNIQFSTRNLNYMNNITRGSILSEESASNESGNTEHACFAQRRGCLKSTHTDVQMQLDDQVGCSFVDKCILGFDIGSSKS